MRPDLLQDEIDSTGRKLHGLGKAIAKMEGSSVESQSTSVRPEMSQLCKAMAKVLGADCVEGRDYAVGKTKVFLKVREKQDQINFEVMMVG
jgi:hypothetical protein